MTTRTAESFPQSYAGWSAHGYAGNGNTSQLVDSEKDRPCIIAGGSYMVFNDILEARRRMLRSGIVNDTERPLIIAANDVGMFLPEVDHWVSLHTDNLSVWKSVRWLQQKPVEPKLHGIDKRPFVDYWWEGLSPLFALSGYFAMQIAHIMGCNPIVLCGCPGSQVKRFFELEARPDFGYGSGPAGSDEGIRQQLIREMNRLPDFKSKVSSMSGWTREFFGSLR